MPMEEGQGLVSIITNKAKFPRRLFLASHGSEFYHKLISKHREERRKFLGLA